MNGESGAALDRATLAGVVDQMGDEGRDLVARYRRRLSDSAAQLESAGERGDLGAIAGVAHALKSVSAMLGADRLSSVSAALEAAARAEHSSESPSLLAEVVEECRRVDREIAAWCRERWPG